MKQLYLDCSMGAAGDMLAAALLELFPEPEKLIAQLNALNLPHITITHSRVQRCGILGTHFEVSVAGVTEHEHMHEHTHEHTHTHTGMQDILHILQHLNIPEQVRTDAHAVYSLLAQAESHAHGKPVDQIHFHEVGTMDAIADIVSVCYLLRQLAPDKIIASPIHVGSGHVHCAHGILPVPAPATAYLLKDIPIYSGNIQSELCTPTGAALLRYFVQEFTQMPPMCVQQIGYGCGSKEFAQANCVRALFGTAALPAQAPEQLVQLCCNLDDMTPEAIGFALERMLEAGALDVFTTPIGMKKNRPAVLLTCLCPPALQDTMMQLFFTHTTTLGVRQQLCQRSSLQRTLYTAPTSYGPVRMKQAAGWGVQRTKPEYEDVAQLARENNVSLQQILAQLK